MLAELSIDISSDWWVILVPVGIPVVVETLSKANASARVKGALAILSSAIVAAINVITDNSGAVADPAILTFGITYGTQLLAYLGWWKPVAGLPGTILPNSGIGGPTTYPGDHPGRA